MTTIWSRRPAIAISIDVETTGPAVLKHSCRQLGAAAVYFHQKRPDGHNSQEWLIDTQCWAIRPQEGKVDDEKTVEFLYRQPGLMTEIEAKQVDVTEAIGDFCRWYHELSQRFNIVIIIASPASFDYAWLVSLVAYYRPDDAPDIQLPIACRDLTTMQHVAEKFFGIDTRSSESILEQHCFGTKHHALNDALRQAWQFLTLRSEMARYKKMLQETKSIQ